MPSIRPSDAQALTAVLAETAPGIKFEVHDDPASVGSPMHFRFVRRIEDRVLTINRDALLMGLEGQNEVIAYAVNTALHDLREQTIRDWGLKPIIQERIEAAEREARVEMRRLLLAWIERQRPQITVQDPESDDPEATIEVAGALPYDLARLVSEWQLS